MPSPVVAVKQGKHIGKIGGKARISEHACNRRRARKIDIVGGVGIDTKDITGGKVNGIAGTCKIDILHFDTDGGRCDQGGIGPHPIVPVTVLQAGPCVVTQVKTVENDGYKAVQVGFVDKRDKLVSKPVKGHFDKAGVSYKRFVREFRFENAEEYSVKDEIKADIFANGDKVDATAVSKGKGFQGAIKRHGQHRGPMAHGSKFHRHQGSNGACSDPSKVFKGKGMPGHMGSKQVTIQNLEIVRVDVENNLLLVKGAVPGPKKSLVTIKETVKASK